MRNAFWLLLIASSAINQQYNSPSIDAFATWSGRNLLQVFGSKSGTTVPTFYQASLFSSAGGGYIGRCWDSYSAGVWVMISFGWNPVLINYVDIFPATSASDTLGLNGVTMSYSNDNVTWTPINSGTAYPLTTQTTASTRIIMGTTIWASYLKMIPTGIWSTSGTGTDACAAFEVNVKLRCRP